MITYKAQLSSDDVRNMYDHTQKVNIKTVIKSEKDLSFMTY